MTKADEALEQAKKEAEAAQTAAASAAVNPPKPPAPPAQAKTAPPVTKVVAPAPKPAAKPKQSIVTIKFNEGMRDVEVSIDKDEGTMTPRKIEHAANVLMKVFRQHLGLAQAKAAREQAARDAKQTDATK